MRILKIFLCTALMLALCVVPALAVDDHTCGSDISVLYFETVDANKYLASGECSVCGDVVQIGEVSFKTFAISGYNFLLKQIPVYFDGHLNKACHHFVTDGCPFFVTWVDTGDHYAYCPECGAWAYVGFVLGDYLPPHTEPTCITCNSLHSVIDTTPAYSNVSIISPAGLVLHDVSSFVSASVGWVGAFVSCIVSNTLLLIFVVTVLIGIGLVLIRRFIRL